MYQISGKAFGADGCATRAGGCAIGAQQRDAGTMTLEAWLMQQIDEHRGTADKLKAEAEEKNNHTSGMWYEGYLSAFDVILEDIEAWHRIEADISRMLEEDDQVVQDDEQAEMVKKGT